MLPLAAAETPAAPAATVLVVLAVVLFLHLLSAVLWPWQKCLKCQDKKKFFAPGGHDFRMCPRCAGKGKEFRVSARVWRGIIGHGWGKHN